MFINVENKYYDILYILLIRKKRYFNHTKISYGFYLKNASLYVL